jgi:hypothetical protein
MGFGMDVMEMGSILATGAEVGGISITGIGARKDDRSGHEVERELCPSCLLFLLSLQRKQ